ISGLPRPIVFHGLMVFQGLIELIAAHGFRPLTPYCDGVVMPKAFGDVGKPAVVPNGIVAPVMVVFHGLQRGLIFGVIVWNGETALIGLTVGTHMPLAQLAKVAAKWYGFVVG